MPYFSWQGIALNGQHKKGKSFAQSLDDLEALLYKRDIALLKGLHARKPLIVSKAIPYEQKIAFFRQLSTLLGAGVLLPEALVIVSAQVHYHYFQEIISLVTRDVHHGTMLSQAFAKHPDVFSSLMIQMAYVGQESGTLGSALRLLSDYLQIQQEFNRQLRSAALMPAITLAFFIMVALAIFIFVIPRFAALFASMKHELPALTKGLIAVSSYVASFSVLYGVLIFGIIWISFTRYSRSRRGRYMLDRLYLKIPYVNNLIMSSNATYFLRSLAMLLQAGLPMATAVHMARNSFTNSALAQQASYLGQEIESGSSLSDAMAQHPSQLFGPEIVAMATVGQESGRMHEMLLYAAQSYDQKVKQLLTTFITLFQPLLMIVLGLLITLLVFAIYLPIFNLSKVVQ